MEFIKNIITAIEELTGIAPTMFSSRIESNVPCINYDIYRDAYNGALSEWRMELRITAETFQEVIEIEEKVCSICTLGDEGKLGCLHIEVNGGGTLEDESTGYPQQLIYFEIYSKE